jgi:hypothetical protein
MDNVSAQQQAYLQHVELIQQHKAVEAHQRLMSQRQDSTAIPLPALRFFCVSGAFVLILQELHYKENS